MEFSIKCDTDKQGWSIVHFEESQVKISKYHVSFSEDQFCLSKQCTGLDEMPHSVAFHLGLHGLQKYSFRGFQSKKG